MATIAGKGKMKRIMVVAVGLGFAFWTNVVQGVLNLDFSGVPGSKIVFYGSSSQFGITQGKVSATNPLGDQWWITGGGTGAALGLSGNFFGGPWTYGAITVSGSDQSALVTSPNATFSIRDGAGLLAIGKVNWVEVITSQYVGGVNAGTTVNITDMSYAGLNPDLVALVNECGGDGSVDLSFQFIPGLTLTDLTTGTGPYKSSYSGTFVAVPEVATIIAGALLLLPLGVSTLRIVRKNHGA